RPGQGNVALQPRPGQRGRRGAGGGRGRRPGDRPAGRRRRPAHRAGNGGGGDGRDGRTGPGELTGDRHGPPAAQPSEGVGGRLVGRPGRRGRARVWRRGRGRGDRAGGVG